SISDDYGIPREWITVTGLGVNREGQPSTDKDWNPGLEAAGVRVVPVDLTRRPLPLESGLG
ncbi:hypothetical protein ACNQUF_11800, partial [Corynebacterium diphtheriae]